MAALWELWRALRIDDFFDDSIVGGVAAQSVLQVEKSILTQQRRSQSYALTMLRQVGASPSTRPARPTFLYPRSHVLMTDVYERPGQEFRRLMAETHGDYRRSFDGVQDRLGAIVATDVQQAANRQERDTYAASKTVVGYRRVLHPELTKSGPCGLCVVAADRFYTKSELQPIHDRCVCTTSPVVKGNDPGLDLNQADLKRIYAAAGGNTRDVLKNIRVEVRENGEIGPILTRKGQEIKTQGTYEEPTAEMEADRLRRQYAATSEWVDALQKAVDAGQSQSVLIGDRRYQVSPNRDALDYQQTLLADLTKKLAA